MVTVVVTLPEIRPCVLRGKFDQEKFPSHLRAEKVRRNMCLREACIQENNRFNSCAASFSWPDQERDEAASRRPPCGALLLDALSRSRGTDHRGPAGGEAP